MSGYTKLFNSILASTVWDEPVETRIVWITLLAMADKYGVAEGSIPGLAVFARLPVHATRIALDRLASPDPDSRSKEEGGRRIEVVEGGWRLVNHAKYRAKMGADERREYLKIKAREYRKQSVDKSSLRRHNVANRRLCRHNTEAEAEATTEALEVHTSAEPDFEAFRQAYPTNRRQGGKAAEKAFNSARARCLPSTMIAALEQQKRSEQWQTPKLIPLMTTWLHQERWLQTLPEPGQTEPTNKRIAGLIQGGNAFLRGDSF